VLKPGFVGEIREMAGHHGNIECVAWTPDGRRVLTTSLDKSLCLWDVSTGELLRRFEGHTAAVRGLVILPDGKRAISACSDKTARLWELETGRELRRFVGHSAGVQWVHCSADGHRLISAGSDGFLRLWNIDNGQELKAWEAHPNSQALSVAFLPDGKRVVSGGRDKLVKLWDLETEQMLDQHAQNNFAWRVDVSSAGNMVAVLDGSNIELLDLKTRQWNTIEVATKGIASAVFSPNGRFILCGGYDGTLRLMNVAMGNEVLRLDRHTKQTLGVAFSPDARLAASGGRDDLVRIWQLPEFVSKPPN
jgi:WD40 repeat protein